MPLSHLPSYYLLLCSVRNFTALARTVASNWRSIDSVTLGYCKSVAQVLKERHAELIRAKGELQKEQKQSKHGEEKTTPPAGVSKEDDEEEAEKGTGLHSPNREEASLIQLRHLNVITPRASMCEEDAVAIVNQENNLFEQNQLTVDYASMPPPPIVTSLMSSLNHPMAGEDTQDLSIHDDMLWQLEERNPIGTMLRASTNDAIPYEQLMSAGPIDWWENMNINCMDDANTVNITDGEVYRMWGGGFLNDE
jgi:hypothetical protein